MNDNVKITKDGYVWQLISKEEAIAMVSVNAPHAADVCLLYDDDSECADFEMQQLYDWNGEIGIGVGYLHELLKQYQHLHGLQP